MFWHCTNIFDYLMRVKYFFNAVKLMLFHKNRCKRMANNLPDAKKTAKKAEVVGPMKNTIVNIKPLIKTVKIKD